MKVLWVASFLLPMSTFLWGAPPAEAVDVCIPGHFLYTPKQGPDICQKCYPGTFMPHHLHTYRQCFECSQIQDPQLEILVGHCNTQQDTHIKCIDGYFRSNPAHPEPGGKCQKCKSCPFVTHPCQNDRDTLCCPGKDYAVRVNKEGNPECVRLCGPGQFLDPVRGQCLICPVGTFMQEERNTNIYCWNCHIPNTDKQEILIRPCGPTQPAIIGCKEGYYQRSSSIYPFDGCAKCQMCSESTTGHVYEVRPCNVTHNTVCGCPPDMIEVNTPGGPECKHIAIPKPRPAVPLEGSQVIQIMVKACGKGEYLRIDSNKLSATTCLPCPKGTCMTETNHFRTSCQACSGQKEQIDTEEQMMTSGCARKCNWSVIVFPFIVLFFHLSFI